MERQYGSVHIHLSDNMAYKWTAADAGCVRGYTFAGDELLKGEALLAYLMKGAGSREALEQRIVALEGFFNFILNAPFGVVACVDQARSMPLFYKTEGTVEIFDYVGERIISGAEFDKDALGVFRNCVFTPNEKTLLKGVSQVKTGYYLVVNGTECRQYPHFKIKYADQQISDLEEAIPFLDDGFCQTFQRAIRVLNGRTAVIPLSGGHDSRLLAFYLKRLGYSKVIAYSYGLKEDNPESVPSRKVAEILGIPWYFTPCDPKGTRRFYEKEYSKFALLSGNGTSLPHVQEWYPVYQLKRQGVLPEDSVFVPGIMGDFIAGDYIWRDAVQEETITAERIIQFLMKYEFAPSYFFERKCIASEEEKRAFRAALMEEFPVLTEQGRMFTGKEANEIIEQEEADSWYSKFIENAVRPFDYFGYEWLTPFYERFQFAQWGRIHNSLRCFRKAYFELAKRIYPKELNEVGFAKGPDTRKLGWKLQALLKGPSFAWYGYGYCKPGLEYYRGILHRNLKGPNVYIQDDYLDLLKSIMD